MASQTKWTVFDYHRLSAEGMFRDEERVELIDGDIVMMSPFGPKHMSIVKRIARLLHRRLETSLVIGVQDAVRLDDNTEPNPDISVLLPNKDDYEDRVPLASDILLLIEVADTTLNFDREQKIPRYAQAQIPETWLVDVAGATVLQYARPIAGAYPPPTRCCLGDTVACRSIQGLTMTVNEIFRR